MVNPSIIPFNLHEMHLERLSKKVKFALIDRRNATREQVPIGHFTIGLLICTLISENQGLEKLRSVSNLEKKSGPAHLIFFSRPEFFFSLSPEFFFMFMA